MKDVILVVGFWDLGCFLDLDLVLPFKCILG